MPAKITVGYSKRQVNCKKCDEQQIIKDQIRVGKRIGSTRQFHFYHPGCFSAALHQGSARNITLQDLDSVEGVEELTSEDQTTMALLFSSLKSLLEKLNPVGNSAATTGTDGQCSSGASATCPTNNDLRACHATDLSTCNATNLSSCNTTDLRNCSTTDPTSNHTDPNQTAGLADLPAAASLADLPPAASLADLPAAGGGSSSPNPGGSANRDLSEPPRKKVKQGNIEEENSDTTVETMKKTQEHGREEEDICCVCLDPPVHPVSLPCGHTYCYLCAKALAVHRIGGDPSYGGSVPSGANSYAVGYFGQSALCSLCRQPIPPGYLESAQVIQSAVVESLSRSASTDTWQWFYQGRNGWWRFEARNNAAIEEAFLGRETSLDTMICGTIYVIDFVRMEQYQKNFPAKKRRIKRDLKSSDCKGVAGLHRKI